MNVVTQFPAARAYDHDLLFQAMFEGAAIGIGICRLDGRILEANPALSRMLGYSQQELAGAHDRELFPELRRDISRGNPPPDERRTDERWVGELMRGERDWFESDKLCRRKDGSEFWGHLTVSLGRDARRHFLIAMLADATERKRVEEQSAPSREDGSDRAASGSNRARLQQPADRHPAVLRPAESRD